MPFLAQIMGELDRPADEGARDLTRLPAERLPLLPRGSLPLALEARGAPPDHLEAACDRAPLHSLPERERAILAWVDQVTLDAPGVTDRLVAATLEHVREDQLVELTVLMRTITMLNQYCTAFDVPAVRRCMRRAASGGPNRGGSLCASGWTGRPGPARKRRGRARRDGTRRGPDRRLSLALRHLPLRPRVHLLLDRVRSGIANRRELGETRCSGRRTRARRSSFLVWASRAARCSCSRGSPRRCSSCRRFSRRSRLRTRRSSRTSCSAGSSWPRELRRCAPGLARLRRAGAERCSTGPEELREGRRCDSEAPRPRAACAYRDDCRVSDRRGARTRLRAPSATWHS